MMGGMAFILLKDGQPGPETAKQAEIRLASLLKILQIARFGAKGRLLADATKLLPFHEDLVWVRSANFPIMAGAAAGERWLNTFCSLFVLIVLFGGGAYFEQASTGFHASATLDVETIATFELTRASEPAAKVADTTGASSTRLCRRHLWRGRTSFSRNVQPTALNEAAANSVPAPRGVERPCAAG
jgi:hypothetical protein